MSKIYDIKVCARHPVTGKWYVAMGGTAGSRVWAWREIKASEVNPMDIQLEMYPSTTMAGPSDDQN
jgi:hypothetical protein